MIDDTNQDPAVVIGTEEVVSDKIELSKSEYEELVKTKSDLGSLKREYKDFKKSVETKDEKKESPGLDYSLVEKAFFKASGLQNSEEQELAKDFAKRTGESLDKVLEDEIFTAKLEKFRTTKANELAADGKTGRSSDTMGRNSAEYWLAKLGPNDPVPADLPRDLRQKIVAARVSKSANSKVFYND